MSQTNSNRVNLFQRMLDWIEVAGNKVPHPAVLFFLLMVIVIALSVLLNWMEVSVSYQRVNPETDEIESATTAVNSLLSAGGIRFIFTSVVPNFINFGPVGIILVAMIGIGLAERAGLFDALIRKIVAVAPRSLMTGIVVSLGVLSSIASDAGYLVLIPLGAAAFLSLGRHPLAGLAAAFAGVAAAFGANILVKPIDGILAEMSNDAVKAIDASQSIDITANFYFGIVSSIVLVVICTLITDRIIEPRLGAYQGDATADGNGQLSEHESRGLTYAFLAVAAAMGLVLFLTLPAGAPLRDPETGTIIGDSPFMDSLVFLIMLLFGVAGIAYGAGAKTIKSVQAGIDSVMKTFADLGGLLFLFFVISQFVAYFNYSNMGTVLAVKLANALGEANWGSIPLLLGFIAIGLIMSIPVPNIVPKWAILAPIFVPLFVKLGISPDVVLAAYRVSDSPPNVINPLLPHFALVVGFAQRYQKDAGVGTIVAMMLPYAIVTFVVWALLFFAWFLLGIPFGPR